MRPGVLFHGDPYTWCWLDKPNLHVDVVVVNRPCGYRLLRWWMRMFAPVKVWVQMDSPGHMDGKQGLKALAVPVTVCCIQTV
ncbi:hypothetical protein RHRU231_450098 [Rhodococcus ruber]|uniref:Uncharacterized protein n=1 Tax=Rhodococcus ruber TaxID=1830 RepID=A0A098BMI7_9NOCA|nr:hypothetical protein RHRU231_450098 [Rhodococcus ruber]